MDTTTLVLVGGIALLVGILALGCYLFFSDVDRSKDITSGKPTDDTTGLGGP